jgi:hypothetical protein
LTAHQPTFALVSEDANSMAIPKARLRNSHFHLIFLLLSFGIAISFLFQSSRLLLLLQEDATNAVPDQKRAIFYNVFIPESALYKQTALSTVREQLAEWKSSKFAQSSSSSVYYTVIGNNATKEVQELCEGVGPNNNCHLLQYVEQGEETLTLKSLFDYCTDHPDALVSYLHNKGSLHPTMKNKHFRKLLTTAVFSDECQQTAYSKFSSCSVCGARFSPFPHLHMAGNMWTAHCSYIQKLIPPKEFGDKMDSLMNFVMTNPKEGVPRPTFQQIQDEYFVGIKRFSSEHWVGSHPFVQPCDVYPGKYLSGYIDVPNPNTEEWTPDLQVAPRFPVSIFEKRSAKGSWFCGQSRLLEFQFLYGIRPPPTSFVWSFYTEAFKTCSVPLSRSEHLHLFANLSTILQ